MANAVQYIRAANVHRRFDLELRFQPGVNILYGENGTGKTTLLHILANVLNGDFERFAFIPFETIEVCLDDGKKIKLQEYPDGDDNRIKVYIDETELTDFSVSETKDRLTYKPSVRQDIAITEHHIQHFQNLKPILQSAYFPAFRTLIEASSNTASIIYEPYYINVPRGIPERETIVSTVFARRFFGDFVPWLNYPSPERVSQKLSREMQQVLNVVADTDRQLLSKAFLDIFAALSQESDADISQPEHILERIESLFSRLESSSIISDSFTGEEVYSKLRELVLAFEVRPGTEAVYVPILKVYESSLEERANIQEKSHSIIKTYLDSVNLFLNNKDLVFTKAATSPLPILQVKFRDTDSYSKIQALSSGERQIVTLIYSATHMSEQKVVLIDEPEISLHIDWQSLLLPEMVAQLPDRQIITCTHSPMIGVEYEDQMIKLVIKPTDVRIPLVEDTVEEIEDNL